MTTETLPVYFHGVPGGAAELNLFGAEIAARVSHFVVAQRDFVATPEQTDRFTLMATAIRNEYPNRPIRLVGFSMGAAAVLRVATVLGSQIERIDLVSAAAPLTLNDYLGKMAGASVFRCARNHPGAFGLLSKGQSWLAKASPSTLYSVLFSSAQGADMKLRDDPQFKAIMVSQLRNYLSISLDAYRYEILSYVRDWSQLLPQVTQPVSIFHGHSDNWSPVEMATDLAAKLSNCQRLEIMDGCSHYSALKAFLQDC